MTLIPIALWAHSLSAGQRNGTDAGYSAVIVVWVLLVATTLAALARARAPSVGCSNSPAASWPPSR